MKTFTAKQLSRTPAKVFEAAREDGKVEVTHDRFSGRFQLCHAPEITQEIPSLSVWDENIVYRIGDEFIKDGVRCIITQTSSVFNTYKKPSEEG